MVFNSKLDKKARFARDRAARGWSLAYHGSCIDPMDQSKPLDPTLKVAGARRIRTIRLLVNDVLVARPVMVQCNPWENPVYFDGCCTHTEKIKFLLWHRVFVYTMEEVRMILYDY